VSPLCPLAAERAKTEKAIAAFASLADRLDAMAAEAAPAVVEAIGGLAREEPSEDRNHDTEDRRHGGHYRGHLCCPVGLSLLDLGGFSAPLGFPTFLIEPFDRSRPAIRSKNSVGGKDVRADLLLSHIFKLGSDKFLSILGDRSCAAPQRLRLQDLFALGVQLKHVLGRAEADPLVEGDGGQQDRATLDQLG
jgi:hypothetical protein